MADIDDFDADAARVRQQMTETRTALSEKLETLEHQVKETVQEARAAVQDTVVTVREAVHDTVGSIKDSVHDTVDSVKDTLDVERQVQRHPLGMVAGATALGILGGYLLFRDRAPRHANGSRPYDDTERFQRFVPTASRQATPPMPVPPAHEPSERPVRPEQDGWMAQLGKKLEPELDKVKSLAIGTTVALVRDLVMPSVPPALSGQVREMLDNVATKLGGQPIREPILSETPTYHQHRN